MLQLHDDILLHMSSYLNYGDAVGIHGLSSVNKATNLLFKNSPKILKRRVKIQERVIDTCLYHYDHNTKNAIIDKRISWKHTKLPKIEDYLDIPMWITENIKDEYKQQVIKAQNRIRKDRTLMNQFH